MSAKTRLSLLAVNTQAKATAELLSGGFFDVMTGDRPDSADDLVSEDMRLVRHEFGAVAFSIPRDGVLRANPIAKAVVTRTGDPTWCRCLTKDGVVVMDGTVGRQDANAITKVATLVAGGISVITEFKHIISRQGAR